MQGRGPSGRHDVALVMVLALVLLACGAGLSPQVDAPTGPHESLVFGYIDMEDAPTSLDWATIKRVAPPNDQPYFGMRIEDGAFYNEKIEPGSYILESFGSDGGFFQEVVTYQVPSQDNPVRLMVVNPGIYFLGSWKYVDVDTGFFEAEKYDLIPSPSPSAVEVAKRVLPNTEGTVWHERLSGFIAHQGSGP